MTDTQPCRWFARCPRDATGVTAHPMGDVPTCCSCNRFAEGSDEHCSACRAAQLLLDEQDTTTDAPRITWTDAHRAALDAAVARVDMARRFAGGR